MERGKIQALLGQQLSQAEIGREIGRHRSVICRELKRNGGHRSGYCAQRAQKRYHAVRKDCVPPKRLDHLPLWKHVIENLDPIECTPEILSRRLPLLYPDDLRMRISYEALYQAIYSDKRLHFLIKVLPQARSKRRERGQGKSRRGPSIPNRVGIEQRPELVDERSRFGDWEGDLVVGAKQQGYILTLVDRKARKLVSRKLETKEATEVAYAVIDALIDLPISWVKTITFDNGTEFAQHEKMAKALGIEIFFAAPYASYQRGTNENTNGLIRRELPKGTSFKHQTPKNTG
jgi:IS30 family transposase